MSARISDAMFDLLVGQEKIWDQLTAAFRNDRVASAYLFHGPTGVGKEGFALKFGALVNCQTEGEKPCGSCSSCKKFESLQHPNLTFLVPFPKDRAISKKDPAAKALSDKSLKLLEKLIRRKAKNPYLKIALPRANTILLNSVRDLRQSIYLRPIEPGRKVVLIFDAHKLMTQQGESGNALLKVLEEPPGDTSLILVTDNPDRLAETILSRCQRTYFPPVPEKVVQDYLVSCFAMNKEDARLVANLSQGDVRAAQNLAEEDLREVEQLIRTMVGWISHETEEGWRSFLNYGNAVYRTDPQEFLDRLKLLTYWFRDAMYVQKVDGQINLILEKMEEDVRGYANEFSSANFGEIVLALEMCNDSLSRNYNLNLVLMNLLLDIRHHISG